MDAYLKLSKNNILYNLIKLKQLVKEVASRLKDDDNGIFAIYKIK